MSSFSKNFGWAGCIACLAIAVAAATSFAQEQQDGTPYQSQQQSSDEESQSQQQDSQSTQQDQQRDQQYQQRDHQQNQKRAQQRQQRSQQYQRGQQSQQRDQQPWDERSSRNQQGRDSQWSRDRDQQFGRDNQWSREYQFSRDSQQRGQQGGLGVSIESDNFGLVIVTRVYRDSPADEMGIQEGDRITHINGQEVQSSGQFISRIRSMQPGEEVEIDVQRDNEEQTFRGELESRQQALVMRGAPIRSQSRWQQGRDTWQTGYEEDRQSGPTPAGQSGRSVDRQVGQIERQLNQLSREIEELRFAVQELRDQSGRSSRETTARYDEYRDRDFQGTPGGRQRNQRSGQFQSDQSDQNERRPGQAPREYQEGFRSGESNQGTRSRETSEGESIGGQIGEERLHPGIEN